MITEIFIHWVSSLSISFCSIRNFAVALGLCWGIETSNMVTSCFSFVLIISQLSKPCKCSNVQLSVHTGGWAAKLVELQEVSAYIVLRNIISVTMSGITFSPGGPGIPIPGSPASPLSPFCPSSPLNPGWPAVPISPLVPFGPTGPAQTHKQTKCSLMWNSGFHLKYI